MPSATRKKIKRFPKTRKRQGKRQRGGDKTPDEKLIEAIEKNNESMAKEALEAGANPTPALFTATEYDNLPIVKLLLDKGADPNVVHEASGFLPLYIACYMHNPDMVELLLEKGAKIPANFDQFMDRSPATDAIIQEAVNKSAVTLFESIEENNPQAVVYDIEQGANVNAFNQNGETPLYVASSKGLLDIVDILLENGADIDKETTNGSTPLYAAAEAGYTGIVEFLMEHGANVTDQILDNMHTFDQEIDDTFNYYRKKNQPPLFTAIEDNDIKGVESALDEGADVDGVRQNRKPLIVFASNFPYTENIIKLLLERGADINRADPKGITAVSNAAFMGHANIVKILIENGADVNKADNNGSTPLFEAASTGNEEIINLLLEKGSTINKQDNTGTTPLYAAAHQGHANIIEILINNGADMEIADTMGFTPLYIAVHNGRLDAVKVLLEHGAIVTPEILKDEQLINNRHLTDLLLKKNLNVYSNTIAQPPSTAAEAPAAAPQPVESFFINPLPTDDMKYIVIPKGTLLYNGFYLDKTLSEMELVSKMMGGIFPFSTNVTYSPESNSIKVEGCIDRFQTKYFYSNPAGSSALQIFFNAYGVFETKRDIRIAVMMSPSKYHRLENEPPVPSYLYNCHKTSPLDCECATTTTNNNAKCKYGYPYDLCISPKYLTENNLEGHIAIAGQDSYEKVMKPLYTHFLNYRELEPYFDTHKVLFEECRSKDIRPSGKEYTGFPELVLHTFNTDWYNQTSAIRFSKEFPVTSDPVRTMIKTMIALNASDDTSLLGFNSPLKLIRVAINNKWYNFENGSRFVNDKNLKPLLQHVPKAEFYVSNLMAEKSGDLELFMDIRTGFLARKEKLPKIKLEDGQIVPFESLCISPTIPKEGKSDLQLAAESRRIGYFWPKDKVLIPAGAQSGGKIGLQNRFNTTRINRLKNTRVKMNKTNTTRKSINTKAQTKAPTTPAPTPDPIESLYDIFMEEIKQHHTPEAISKSSLQSSLFADTRSFM
jgi:ankyrin repeat protein